MLTAFATQDRCLEHRYLKLQLKSAHNDAYVLGLRLPSPSDRLVLEADANFLQRNRALQNSEE